MEYYMYVCICKQTFILKIYTPALSAYSTSSINQSILNWTAAGIIRSVPVYAQEVLKVVMLATYIEVSARLIKGAGTCM